MTAASNEDLTKRVEELERLVKKLVSHAHQAYPPHPHKPESYQYRTTRPIGFGSER